MHVFDTGAAADVRGMHVTLYRLGEDDRPIRLTQALTDEAGWSRDLLGRPMSPGIYRLALNLAGGRGPGTGDDHFFRRMTIDLRILDASRSCHVPVRLATASVTSSREG
jgi:5-hydroxyisourate hydrolase-like protein (transthyretin family)